MWNIIESIPAATSRVALIPSSPYLSEALDLFSRPIQPIHQLRRPLGMLSSMYIALALALGGSCAPAGSSSSLASPSSSLAPPSTKGSSTFSGAEPTPTVPYASDNPNFILWNDTEHIKPEAIRGSLGASVIGPQNIPIDRQNADLLAPPTTDNGLIDNAKWPFGLSKNRIQTGGWARQQNVNVMPIATSMAGVDMRLEPGAIRELHWHVTSEWAYVLKGSTQITSVDTQGRNYIATVKQGDLWYFPPGIPHSLQGTDDDPDGTEFLLIFDSGTFSEDSTFQVTDWLAHTPKEVIAKNFQVPESAFDKIPSEELYIFPGPIPADNQQDPTSPYGTVPEPFSFALSEVNATQHIGGTVKIADSSTFKISTTIAVADVTVEPGAMREMHWHPTQDEWTFFLEGNARMTLFASSATANTFDYEPGDIGFIPATYGHYVENTGNTTLHYLEIFNTAHYEDISLNQWLALTPPDIVQAHLQISNETVSKLMKVQPVVI